MTFERTQKFETHPVAGDNSTRSATLGMMAATFFDDSETLRVWLAANHATATELVIGFHKKGSGRAGLSYAEVVDQALCFGWIDGVMRPIDGHSYGLRFTPRKAGSIWSKVNIAKVEVLLERGLMERAGLAAFERRTADKTGVYSFEQESPELDPASVETFKGDADAWASWGYPDLTDTIVRRQGPPAKRGGLHLLRKLLGFGSRG